MEIYTGKDCNEPAVMKSLHLRIHKNGKRVMALGYSIKKIWIITGSYFVLFLLLNILLKVYYGAEEIVPKVIFKAINIAVVIYLVQKAQIFTQSFYLKANRIFVPLCIALVTLIVYYCYNRLVEPGEVALTDFIIFVLSCLATGFFEELAMRVLVFGLAVQYFFKPGKQSFNKEIILASLFFALLHFPNIILMDWQSIYTQVFFAFAIGVLLQALLIRFRNIIFIATLHAVLNMAGGYSMYFPVEDKDTVATPYTAADYIVHIILVTIILIVSFRLIKGRQYVISKHLRLKEEI